VACDEISTKQTITPENHLDSAHLRSPPQAHRPRLR
jgi:hypothetical protein